MEYWVADVGGDLIHQMWGATDAGYTEYHRQVLSDRLEAISLPIVIDLSQS